MQAFKDERGISLVEVLIGLALTALVGLVTGGLLLSTMANGRALQAQTDHYESLRLATAHFLQDARFAVEMQCLSDRATLYTNTTKTNYIQYVFAAWDGTLNGSPHDRFLHRWVVQGGVLQSDDIIGWDLETPDGSTDVSHFDCLSGATYRYVIMHLTKEGLGGQNTGAQLRVAAYLR